MSESENNRSNPVNFEWHLAGDPVEVAFTELEFALMRTFEGFGRWQSECLASVSELAASGPENALLHIIRMNDRPKSIKELARLTNRDDVPNIQYAIRKLVGAGLVCKMGSGRGGVTYEATAEGRKVTDDYSALRRALLIKEIKNLPEFAERFQEAVRTLNMLSGIYEEVSRVAATHRR
ncbi:putative transcription regulator, contains HTH domain (MarR family) [Sulfitobacter noctilucicola]|uniref:Putative MarR family transcription regulator n=2 Tax=Sulfitobacter noctilucicola TaxID=1342301 RepID=A0A7W6M6E2_9RHOB|nr:putative transcription regulator, contains HTH domain (MarR family) [Sulfitobacter noctilucicola]MBB4173219.1 putative MarR family transcription regulator [Sulfitobacter noctilucicola]